LQRYGNVSQIKNSAKQLKEYAIDTLDKEVNPQLLTLLPEKVVTVETIETTKTELPDICKNCAHHLVCSKTADSDTECSFYLSPEPKVVEVIKEVVKEVIKEVPAQAKENKNIEPPVKSEPAKRGRPAAQKKNI